jgi:hypothetical protein
MFCRVRELERVCLEQAVSWVSRFSGVEWNGMVEWNGGVEWWNGMVEWNGGMEWWNEMVEWNGGMGNGAWLDLRVSRFHWNGSSKIVEWWNDCCLSSINPPQWIVYSVTIFIGRKKNLTQLWKEKYFKHHACRCC